jgi:hypothetical protein
MTYTVPVFFRRYNRETLNRLSSEQFPQWTPQERFDSPEVWEALARTLNNSVVPQVAALRTQVPRETFTTINRRPVFTFVEMEYPGNVFPAINGKWIYGFHIASRRCVIEIYAENARLWRYRLNPTPDTQNNAPVPNITVNNSRLELTALTDAPSNYGFMLSPFRLSRMGLRKITDPAQNGEDPMTTSLVRPRWTDQNFAIVALPDPFRWAVDAHEQYYEPARVRWQNWINDFDRQARRTIAGVLKTWIETRNDVYDIRNELQGGQPEAHLREYERDERHLRFPMETAALYLDRWTRQSDHRAVELSALELRGQSISTTLQMWAIVVQNLIASGNGRRMLSGLTDPASERAPRRYVFPDSPSAPSEALSFNNCRYAWLAMLAIFDAASPVWLTHFILRATQAERTSVSRYALAWEYLRRLYNDGTATREQRQIFTRLSEPRTVGTNPLRPLRNNVDTAAHMWRDMSSPQMRRVLQESVQAAEDSMPRGEVSAIRESVDYIHGEYRNPLTRLRFSAGFLIEAFNLSVALTNLRDSNSASRGATLISLGSASADMSSLIFGYLQRRAAVSAVWDSVYQSAGAARGNAPVLTPQQIVANSRSVRAFARLGGAAGLLGGIFQCLDEVNQASNAYSQGQDWQFIGHTTAAAGAAATAVGGGIALAQALGLLAESSIGGWITFAGAALIVGGNVLASVLRRNEYENFARYCYLGRGYNPPAENNSENPRTFDWAQAELNTRSLQSQLRVLQGLLQGFTLQLEGTGRPSTRDSLNFLTINFGSLPANAVLRLEIEQLYGDPARPSRFTASYVVRFASDNLSEVDWSQPNEARDTLISSRLHGFRAHFGSHNTIDRLSFNLTPASLRVNGRLTPFDQFQWANTCFASYVKVQLRAGDILNPRDANRFVRVDTMQLGTGVVNCLDTSRWFPLPD